MQKSDELDKDLILRDLSTTAAKAYKELEMAKQDLREKELELREIAELSNQKINAAAKLNSDLQHKTEMLMNLSSELQTQNDSLAQRNKELEIKESTYNSLNRELRTELEKVTQKEKELGLQKQFLETQVKEKSKELVKAEKMATIGELTSRLAHDLRNPLTVLKSAFAVMKEKPNMAIKDRLKYNGRIDRAILKIVHLVDDVLDYVRISDLELQEVSVSAILESAVDSIDIPETISVKMEKANAPIQCDMRKMEAVFANLISNSIQAMNDDGEIEIRFAEKENYVIIEVQDTGSGIPDSIISKIFDPLFTTKPHGTGLGLSICKTIIEQHGGNIGVKSNPTTFTITLPKNL